MFKPLKVKGPKITFKCRHNVCGNFDNLNRFNKPLAPVHPPLSVFGHESSIYSGKRNCSIDFNKLKGSGPVPEIARDKSKKESFVVDIYPHEEQEMIDDNDPPNTS